MPLITVAMPAYNSADFIGEAIDGILNQTHRDFELIIVNGGCLPCIFLAASGISSG